MAIKGPPTRVGPAPPTIAFNGGQKVHLASATVSPGAPSVSAGAGVDATEAAATVSPPSPQVAAAIGRIINAAVAVQPAAPSVSVLAGPPGGGASDPYLVTLPDWNDEHAAYLAQGLTIDAGDDEHIEGGRYNANDLEKFGLQDVTLPVDTIPGVQDGLWDIVHINGTTENDDLWTAYHQWMRLAGIFSTTVWQQRFAKLADYFINEYLDVINPDGEGSDANHEHLYGFGLCEAVRDGVIVGSEATAARAAIDNQVAYLTSWADTWQGGKVPGSVIADSGPYGRRWARMVRFTVAAYEASPIPANKTLRDRFIDIVLQDPDVHGVLNMHFFDRDRTIGTHALDYDAGERICNTFHMGYWMEALWQAWRVLDAEGDSRALTVRNRLVSMATFYRDFGPNPSGPDVGKIPLFLKVNAITGTRLDQAAGSPSPSYGSPDGVYTIPPTNGLAMAHKLTGLQSFRTAAWTNYKKWLELRDGLNTVGHYVDSILDPTRRVLANNKGELQYAYALFENGGTPVLMFPSWAPAAGQWKDLASVAGVNTINDIAQQPYGIPGTDDPNSMTRHWCGAASDTGYLYIGNQGGHNGGYGNLVARVGPFNTEAGPRATRIGDRTPDGQVIRYSDNGNFPYYLDGKPMARHGRGLSTIVHGISGFADRLFHCGAHDPYNTAGVLDFQVDAFRIVDGEWDAPETYGNMPNLGGSSDRADAVAYDRGSERVIRMVNGGSGASGLQPYNPVTDTWGALATGTPAFGIYGQATVAPAKRLFFGIGGSGSVAFVALLDASGNMIDVLDLGTIAQWAGNGGLCYCPIIGTHGAFLIWGGGQRIDKIEIPVNFMADATTLNAGATWSSVNLGMGGDTPSAKQTNGTFGRFCWIEDSNLVYVLNNVTEPGWVARVA